MEINIRPFLLTFLLVVGSWVGSTAQTTMTLDEAVAFAQANHPNIRAAQIQIADADWRIKENKASGLPQFSGSVDFSHFFQKPANPFPDAFLPKDSTGKVLDGVPRTGSFALANSVSATVKYSQLVFSSPWLVGLKAAAYYRDYVKIQLDVAKATLRNQVRDAYLPTLLLTENVAVLDKNIANLEKLRKETAAINQAGLVESLEVDRLDLSISTLKSERENLTRQREIVVNALKFTMGFPQADALTVADDLKKLLAEINDENLPDQLDFSQRPEMLLIKKGLDLNGLNERIYGKSTALPTVAVFASYGYGRTGDNLFNNAYWVPSGAIAGISIGVPIWDGGATKARLERAKLGTETVRNQQKMVESAFLLEAQNAKIGLTTAKTRLQNEQKNLDLAQRIYDTTEKKYRAGVGSSLELVVAEQSLFSAQSALLTAQYNLLTARVAAKKALGQ